MIQANAYTANEFGIFEENTYGWGGARHLYDADLSLDSCVFAGCVHFALRLETNKVPGAVKADGDVSMLMIRRWRAKTLMYALQLSSAPSDEERAVIRAEIYRAGARKTVRLFNTLPGLIEGTLQGTWLGSPTS